MHSHSHSHSHSHTIFWRTCSSHFSTKFPIYHLPLHPFSLTISSFLSLSTALLHSLSILPSISSRVSGCVSTSPPVSVLSMVGLSQPLRPMNRPHLLLF